MRVLIGTKWQVLVTPEILDVKKARSFSFATCVVCLTHKYCGFLQKGGRLPTTQHRMQRLAIRERGEEESKELKKEYSYCLPF